MPALLLLLASSCVWYAPGEPGDTGRDPYDGDGDDDDGCGIVLANVRPAPLATGVSTTTDVVAAFSGADYGARIYLQDEDGNAVAGETRRTDGGATLVFEPASSLRWSTNYLTTVSWCAGQGDFSFRTDEGEPPLEDKRPGRTYAIDLSQGRFVQPEGVGDLLASQIEVPVLLHVVDVEPELHLRFTTGTEDGWADACVPTTDVYTSDAEYPLFSAEVYAWQAEFDGAPLRFEDLRFDGMWAADASSIGGATATALLDVRQNAGVFEELLGTTTNAQTCAALEGFGVSCQPCDDGVERCLAIEVTELEGTWEEAVDVPERTEEQIAEDVGCGG